MSESSYSISEIPSEIGGRGFQIINPSGITYHVLLDANQGSCECMGYLRWSVVCKHIRMVKEQWS